MNKYLYKKHLLDHIESHVSDFSPTNFLNCCSLYDVLCNDV